MISTSLRLAGVLFLLAQATTPVYAAGSFEEQTGSKRGQSYNARNNGHGNDKGNGGRGGDDDKGRGGRGGRGGHGGGRGDDKPTGAPIDGGASLLLAGGAAYVIRQIQRRKAAKGLPAKPTLR